MNPQIDPTVDETVLDGISGAEPAPVQSSADEEIARLREQLARSRADYDNLVRRSEEDRKSMSKFILGNTLAKLLPLADNLERAVATLPADIAEHPWIAGVRSIRDRFMKDLESMGVRPFDSVGSEIDPDRHEVMSQGPGPAGTVIAEFERGYLLDDRVLRHAKIVAGAGESLPL
jgi:molecular chaperone GrpE